jgi:hypothetical protein
MNTKVKKIIGYLILILPVLAFLGIGTYAQLEQYSDKVRIVEGKCLETFSEQHWHRHSPPETITYSTVRIGYSAYVLRGDCQTAIRGRELWRDQHKVLAIIGCLTQIFYAVFDLVVVLAVIVFTASFAINLIKSKDKPESDE